MSSFDCNHASASASIHRRRRSSVLESSTSYMAQPSTLADHHPVPLTNSRHSTYEPLRPSSSDSIAPPLSALFEPESNSPMARLKRHLLPLTWRRSLLLISIIVTILFLVYHPHSPTSFYPKPSSPISTDLTTKPESKTDCILQPGQTPFQYALMIDAGSTGSRIHVYRFSRCQDSKVSGPSLPKLIDEQFIKTQPGLSAYPNSPTGAAESLRVLLDAAIEGVPVDQRACTPLAVRATAGLRLLGERQSGAIIAEVERWLRSEWPFAVAKGAVSIMGGAEEGVYAWVTINYVCHLALEPLPQLDHVFVE